MALRDVWLSLLPNDTYVKPYLAVGLHTRVDFLFLHGDLSQLLAGFCGHITGLRSSDLSSEDRNLSTTSRQKDQRDLPISRPLGDVFKMTIIQY